MSAPTRRRCPKTTNIFVANGRRRYEVSTIFITFSAVVLYFPAGFVWGLFYYGVGFQLPSEFGPRVRQNKESFSIYVFARREL